MQVMVSQAERPTRQSGPVPPPVPVSNGVVSVAVLFERSGSVPPVPSSKSGENSGIVGDAVVNEGGALSGVAARS